MALMIMEFGKNGIFLGYELYHGVIRRNVTGKQANFSTTMSDIAQYKVCTIMDKTIASGEELLRSVVSNRDG